MELTLESIEGKPHKLFFDYIRSDKTRDNYVLFLQKFLDVVPVSLYKDILNEEPIKPEIAENPEKKFNDQVDQFCRLVNTDIKITKQIIHAFVRELKDKVEKKEIKPGTVTNYLKPIKALFAANEVDFSWKLINKSLPIVGKAPDRAYTREEIQTLLANSHDIIDDVIILLFSSAGFRVEAWDYLTWGDVKFFYTKDKEPKGLAIRIYAGDAEEYWTHATPEAQKMLLLYSSAWKSRFGKEPQPTDPLIVAAKIIKPTRLRMDGVRTRIVRLLRSSGVRPILDDKNKRHEVPADHGFRKYFNTMMRRAKVDYLDKEDLMGHKVGLEGSYERYEEDDFERFPEYQKAIPFLTISDEERAIAESIKDKKEKEKEQKRNIELEKKNQELEDNQKNLTKQKKEINELRIEQEKIKKLIYIEKKYPDIDSQT